MQDTKRLVERATVPERGRGAYRVRLNDLLFEIYGETNETGTF